MKIRMHGNRGFGTNQRGFTLIEMLIAVVILGILAMVVIPQVKSSSDDARVSAAKSDLSSMRNALENYASQHNNVYPGAIKTDGSGAAAATDCVTAFSDQLVKYSQANGKTNVDSTALTVPPIYGPYLKGGALPANPLRAGVCRLVQQFDGSSADAVREGLRAFRREYSPRCLLLGGGMRFFFFSKGTRKRKGGPAPRMELFREGSGGFFLFCFFPPGNNVCVVLVVVVLGGREAPPLCRGRGELFLGWRKKEHTALFSCSGGNSGGGGGGRSGVVC